jgi:hypothetical protein
MSTLDDYWQALRRLQDNQPVRLPKGTAINNDTVALEAGRKRGSIKKSRGSFADLIAVIDSANSISSKQKPDIAHKLSIERSQKDKYREQYHLALNRELMLLERIARLEKVLKRYSNVVPIFER